MRKRHDRHWHSHNEKDHKKSKEDKDGHGQFICVLQRVREILQTRMPTASAREKSVNENTVNDNTVNIFEILELQETSASFLHSKPIHYGKKPMITPTHNGIWIEAQMLTKLTSLSTVYSMTSKQSVHIFSKSGNLTKMANLVFFRYPLPPTLPSKSREALKITSSKRLESLTL